MSAKKWEYKLIETSNVTEEILNDLGRQGWELIWADQSRLGDLRFYFKREKP